MLKQSTSSSGERIIREDSLRVPNSYSIRFVRLHALHTHFAYDLLHISVSNYSPLMFSCILLVFNADKSYTNLKFMNKSDIFCCRCMIKTSNHAGVESYIVKNIKNQVEFSMQVR